MGKNIGKAAEFQINLERQKAADGLLIEHGLTKNLLGDLVMKNNLGADEDILELEKSLTEAMVVSK